MKPYEESLRDWEEARKLAAEEAHKEKITSLKYHSNLPESAFLLKFDDFVTKTESQKRAANAAKEYCWYPKNEAEIAEEHDYRWSITFHGPIGTGKTMLSYLIANIHILELELKTYFWNVADLLVDLRQGYTDDSYYGLLDRVKNCPMSSR